LSAHEWNFRDRVLARLNGPAPAGSRDRPAAQLVFCIDVRSEGLRRRLEVLGSYETFGFAGFFGVPVRWRPLGADVGQARCPVLVSPRHEVAEVAVEDDRAYLSARAATAGLHDAFYAAKGGLASPFALAESAGWIAGPVAAARTLAPPRTPLDADGAPTRRWRRFRSAPRTAPVVDELAGGDLRAGLSLEERTLFAEAIVTTIGMADFAPVVVLCGHGSLTTNNPHASSLDCGACGGAPGGPSARIAVAILNDPDVRAGLAERGIDIPDDTWFVAAEHDTTADLVRILDRAAIPASTRPLVDALQRDLDVAGEQNALDRARRLPGRAARVRDRGRDWAQVRPEWGLAGNGAFIIGPRSITADHDLRGRSFLHSYVAERDPDGVALETIMTAPLVVAQWISSQYYFSTVEPDVFGAGDKMLHNPVGGIGVVVGQSGDLAVGLPMQSVMFGEQRAHDPLRLLAIVQAPLERVGDIIVRNSTLRELVEGEWIHVVARATDHDPWSFRLPSGGWAPWDLDDDRLARLAAADLATPLSIRMETR
ncbi:MAG: putative inorganic carbon transporter subunit DabA, partial [Acidobacteriota bacterium]